MSSKDNLVGQKLGDYKLVHKLTSGGMSHVYIGIDEKLERKAAIKLLTPDFMGQDDSMTQRFEREAKAVAALEHDNIIPIYQFGEGQDMYFLAMRYIEGQDLADELIALRNSGQRMGINRMLGILEQVAAALDYAHEQGIIHRDVKPSNILLDKNDKAYLTDFGLVLRASVDQTLGTAFGTPRYISPEQAVDSQRVVSQSDVYSLAVIVYEILTGEMVFRGATPMEMALAHISEKPVPPSHYNPEIPASVENELLKALDKDPRRRHRTATEFIEALRRGYKMSSAGQQTTPIRSSTPVMDAEEMREIARGVPAPKGVGQQTVILPEKSQVRRQRRSRVPRLLLLIMIVSVTGAGVYAMRDTLPLAEGGVPIALAELTEEATQEVTEEAAATETATETATATDAPTETPTATSTTGSSSPSATTGPTSTTGPTATVGSTSTTGPTATTAATNTTAPTNTSAPTHTNTPQPASPTTAVIVAGTGEPVTLLYNATAFALRNDSAFVLALNTLRLVRGDDDGVDDFYGDLITASGLDPGACVVVKSNTPGVQVPAAWGCTSVRSETLLPSSALFWRSAGSLDSFNVQTGADLLATCPTILRVGEESCTLLWPITAP